MPTSVCVCVRVHVHVCVCASVCLCAHASARWPQSAGPCLSMSRNPIARASVTHAACAFAGRPKRRRTGAKGGQVGCGVPFDTRYTDLQMHDQNRRVLHPHTKSPCCTCQACARCAHARQAGLKVFTVSLRACASACEYACSCPWGAA